MKSSAAATHDGRSVTGQQNNGWDKVSEMDHWHPTLPGEANNQFLNCRRAGRRESNGNFCGASGTCRIRG